MYHLYMYSYIHVCSGANDVFLTKAFLLFTRGSVVRWSTVVPSMTLPPPRSLL